MGQRQLLAGGVVRRLPRDGRESFDGKASHPYVSVVRRLRLGAVAGTQATVNRSVPHSCPNASGRRTHGRTLRLSAAAAFARRRRRRTGCPCPVVDITDDAVGGGQGCIFGGSACRHGRDVPAPLIRNRPSTAKRAVA